VIEVTDISPGDGGDWMLVRARDLKNHYVHKCLYSQLVADLESRGYHIYDSTPTVSTRFELPVAVYFASRPEEHLKIDVLSITIPSRDVEITMHNLMSLPERTFHDDKEYFKLKCERTCIVMTPDQRDAFALALQSLVVRANKREDAFFERLTNEKKKEDKE